MMKRKRFVDWFSLDASEGVAIQSLLALEGACHREFYGNSIGPYAPSPRQAVGQDFQIEKKQQTHNNSGFDGLVCKSQSNLMLSMDAPYEHGFHRDDISIDHKCREDSTFMSTITTVGDSSSDKCLRKSNLPDHKWRDHSLVGDFSADDYLQKSNSPATNKRKPSWNSVCFGDGIMQQDEGSDYNKVGDNGCLNAIKVLRSNEEVPTYNSYISGQMQLNLKFNVSSGGRKSGGCVQGDISGLLLPNEWQRNEVSVRAKSMNSGDCQCPNKVIHYGGQLHMNIQEDGREVCTKGESSVSWNSRVISQTIPSERTIAGEQWRHCHCPNRGKYLEAGGRSKCVSSEQEHWKQRQASVACCKEIGPGQSNCQFQNALDRDQYNHPYYYYRHPKNSQCTFDPKYATSGNMHNDFKDLSCHASYGPAAYSQTPPAKPDCRYSDRPCMKNVNCIPHHTVPMVNSDFDSRRGLGKIQNCNLFHVEGVNSGRTPGPPSAAAHALWQPSSGDCLHYAAQKLRSKSETDLSKKNAFRSLPDLREQQYFPPNSNSTPFSNAGGRKTIGMSLVPPRGNTLNHTIPRMSVAPPSTDCQNYAPQIISLPPPSDGNQYYTSPKIPLMPREGDRNQRSSTAPLLPPSESDKNYRPTLTPMLPTVISDQNRISAQTPLVPPSDNDQNQRSAMAPPLPPGGVDQNYVSQMIQVPPFCDLEQNRTCLVTLPLPSGIGDQNQISPMFPFPHTDDNQNQRPSVIPLHHLSGALHQNQTSPVMSFLPPSDNFQNHSSQMMPMAPPGGRDKNLQSSKYLGGLWQGAGREDCGTVPVDHAHHQEHVAAAISQTKSGEFSHDSFDVEHLNPLGVTCKQYSSEGTWKGPEETLKSSQSEHNPSASLEEGKLLARKEKYFCHNGPGWEYHRGSALGKRTVCSERKGHKKITRLK